MFQRFGKGNLTLLPKYAALNVFARFDNLIDSKPPHAPESMITFAYKDSVKRSRMTITPVDSLQAWCNDNAYQYYVQTGLITDVNTCPSATNPWGSGPIGVFAQKTGVKASIDHVISGRPTSYPSVEKIWEFLGDIDTYFWKGLGHDASDNAVPWSKPFQRYIEAQIHGPVSIERDISHVYLDFPHLFGNPLFDKLYKFLVSKSIRIVWYYRYHESKTRKQVCIQESPGGEEAEAAKAKRKALKTLWKNKLNALQTGGWTGMGTGKPRAIAAIRQKVPADLRVQIEEAWDGATVCTTGALLDGLTWAKYYVGKYKRT